MNHTLEAELRAASEETKAAQQDVVTMKADKQAFFEQHMANGKTVTRKLVLVFIEVSQKMNTLLKWVITLLYQCAKIDQQGIFQMQPYSLVPFKSLYNSYTLHSCYMLFPIFF